MDKAPRPPGISVSREADEGTSLKRESSLLPGEIRTPAFAITTLTDWAAPGSNVWDNDDPASAPIAAQAPIAGYSGDTRVSVPASSMLREGGAETAEGSSRARHDGIAGAAAAASVLQVFSSSDAPVSMAPPPRSAMKYSNGAGRDHNQHLTQPRREPAYTRSTPSTGTQIRGCTHRSLYSTPSTHNSTHPNHFTVQGGGLEMSSHPGADHYGMNKLPYTRSTTHPRERSGLPQSLLPDFREMKSVEQTVPFSGIPTHTTPYVGSGVEGLAAPHNRTYTDSQSYRNYQDPIEPPGQRGSEKIGGGPYSYTNISATTQSQQGYDRVGGSTYSTSLITTQRSQLHPQSQVGGQGSDWNVESPARIPYTASSHVQSSKNNFVVRVGSSPSPSDRTAEKEYYQHRPYSTQSDCFTVSSLPNIGYQGPAAITPSVVRPMSDSDTLSNLLHFHAKFFPPPPPPRVPPSERRRRAELWYHYASKWDVSHRLPPPPRTPLPEMEMEYRMRLQEMTRVPYRGEGWLKMSERWFDVVQSLFDYPTEGGGGVEVNVDIIFENAVMA